MRRKLDGKWRWIATIFAIGFTTFQVYTAGFGLLLDIHQRTVHVLFGLSLAFLLYSATKRAQPETRVPVWDILLILLVIASAVNAFVRYEWFIWHPAESTPVDLFLGAAIILLAVEASRRIHGWVFSMLTLAALLYAFLGPYIPGLLGHGGFSLETVLIQLYQTTLGVWGFMVGLTATILAIFIIFGSFLLFTGGGQTFIDLAIWLAGRLRGGPALVAVVASAMFGTISGSAVVNVATTGNYTIPMMKRLGYKPEFAGAVEVAASSGGQLTPPIMGAGAFIMAELIGIPYLKVALAAAIPAFLFYVAVFSSVRLEALKQNLAPVPAEQIPAVREVLTWGRLAPLVLPVAALLWFLLQGFSPVTAGFWAWATAFITFLFSNLSLPQMKQRVKVMISGLERAGLALVELSALSVCVGIIVALISLTGVGVKLSTIIVDLAGGFPLLALVLAAVVALILGMGMPTTAAYLIGASVLASALAILGVPLLAGHLFIFYFAIISAMTPPVCFTAYVAATIAGTKWVKVATIALKLAMVAYVIPFVFVYKPELLMQGDPLRIVLMVALTALGAWFIAVGNVGYFTTRLSLIARLVTVLGGLLLLLASWPLSLAGIAVIALALLSDTFARRLILRRRESRAVGGATEDNRRNNR